MPAVRVNHRRLDKRGLRRGPRGTAVPCAAQSAGCGQRLADARQVAHADDHLAVDLETEQDAEERHAVDEAARAVDGVDEPAVRRAAGVGAGSSPTIACDG